MRKSLAALFAAVAVCILAPSVGLTQAGGYQWTLTTTSATAGSSPALVSTFGKASCSVTVDGTWSGTLNPEGSAGGSVQPIPATQNTPGATAATTITANGVYNVSVANYATFDVRLSALASGSPTVSISCSNVPLSSSSSGGGGGSYTAPPIQAVAGPNSSPVAVSGPNQAPVPVSGPSGSPLPIALPSGATDAAGRLITSPSSAPSPCATYSSGICETYTYNTIAATGPTTITGNGTYTAALSGVHAGCDVQTNSGWIGTITAKTQGSGSGYLPADLYSQTAAATSTVSPGVSSVQAAASDYWVPTSGKVSVELIITNYALGNVTIRCDVAAPQWVEAIPVSDGVGLGAGGTNAKAGFLQTITLAQAVTGSGTAQLVALSSVSGLVPNETLALTTGGGETVTLLNVYSNNNTVYAIFADSHSSGDTIIPSSSQTFNLVLGGNQNSCSIHTDSTFNGTIAVKTTNSTSYSSPSAIGTSTVSTALSGYPYSTLTGANASWSVPVGSELGVQFIVTGATAGSFTPWCDVGRAPPLAVISQLPTFGAGPMIACPAASGVGTPITPGPNGTRVSLNSGGSISYAIALASPAPTSTPTAIFTVTAAQVPFFNQPLQGGYEIYIESGTSGCLSQTI